MIEHGGNIYAAVRESGLRLNQVVDFSANINPLGPSSLALRAVARALDTTAHYPDPDCVALRVALAERYQLSPEQLIMGNGSSELIHLLPHALPITRALIVGPTFSEYARAVSLGSGRVIEVTAKRAEQYRPPIEEVIETVQKNRAIDAVFLCTPNNPTGQAVDVEDIREVIRATSRRKAWLILDETFVDYCEERSIVAEVTRYSKLVVLRSFTKFYALPALRIGYLAGDVRTVRQIRRRQPPWSVNMLAQVAALSSINDESYVRKSRAIMEVERPRLAKGLASLPGVRVYPSAGNFLLVDLALGYSAREIAGLLRRRGLLVKVCSGTRGLSQQAMRIAVRTPAQNRRLIAALRGLLSVWPERHHE
jgi:threonine-phosphate decarboxylase